MLSWRELFAAFWRLSTLSMRIVFHRKVLFMWGGILAYYGILYAFAVYRPGEGFSVEQALLVLIEVPAAVLAIYLTMDLVAGERDRDTLEILFSASASHYGTWAVRLLAICAAMLIVLLFMSALAYVLFAEFPFVLGALNAFVPAFFMLGLTFYFSVLCRSGNAAGMLAMGVLIGVLLSANALQNTPYFLFVNPFESPESFDESLWFERVIMNRIAIGALGSLFVFFALRRMDQREKLL